MAGSSSTAVFAALLSPVASLLRSRQPSSVRRRLQGRHRRPAPRDPGPATAACVRSARTGRGCPGHHRSGSPWLDWARRLDLTEGKVVALEAT